MLKLSLNIPLNPAWNLVSFAVIILALAIPFGLLAEAATPLLNDYLARENSPRNEEDAVWVSIVWGHPFLSLVAGIFFGTLAAQWQKYAVVADREAHLQKARLFLSGRKREAQAIKLRPQWKRTGVFVTLAFAPLLLNLSILMTFFGAWIGFSLAFFTTSHKLYSDAFAANTEQTAENLSTVRHSNLPHNLLIALNILVAVAVTVASSILTVTRVIPMLQETREIREQNPLHQPDDSPEHPKGIRP